MSQFHSTMSQDSDFSILGTHSMLEDLLWYLDSGVSMKDQLVFSNKHVCHGIKDVKTDNGTCMCIKHIGSAYYVSPYHDNKFVLHNLLHVYKNNKNLIIVSKFTQDNNVYFEFFPDTCFVKHKETIQILLQGVIKDGLHVFPAFRSQCALSAHH